MNAEWNFALQELNQLFTKMTLPLAIVFLTFLAYIDLINGHGRMLLPLQRSSMWRNYDTPKNYDDNALNCGGFAAQYELNGGKCGPCGDDFASSIPRDNELGGLYGHGPVSGTFRPGSLVPVFIQLTASHKGYFNFDLCLTQGKPETEDCFQPLYLANGQRNVAVPTFDAQNFTTAVLLPKDVSCERCTIRWHYRAGNNIGNCANGASSPDCVNQETFRNCADVAIST